MGRAAGDAERAARIGTAPHIPALPIKPAYGPTFGTLIAPRWRSASRGRRLLTLLALALLAAALLAAVLGAQSPTISHGGAVPFSFTYKGLYRGAPEPGQYVRVQRASGRGASESFAVGPLRLPPYSGSVTGELPLYAGAYLPTLAARFAHLTPIGEGPIRTSAFGSWEELPPSTVYYHVPTYTLAFTAERGGAQLAGRVIWVLPDRPGVRNGLAITMLAPATGVNHAAVSPLSLGTTGSLSGPLRSFALSG
ncbi:MAG: hypothetical protein KGJ43_05465 [Acidobacteriota bacterium]|nr:hypothetical protein [Acidobacteriota bacterium]